MVKFRFRALLFLFNLSLSATFAAQISGPKTNAAIPPPIFPALAVTNESGRTVPVLSLEAYRAEFRYLRRICHAIDLSGSAKKMTGHQKDVPETQ
jgi:hypothetical protein